MTRAAIVLTVQEQWVTKLALLTAAGREPITMAHIREYGDMLTREIPLSALTDASREHIAANCERGFFPPWPILKAGLLAWYTDHPDRLMLEYDGAVASIHQQRQAEADRLHELAVEWGDPARVRASVRKVGDDRVMGRFLASLIKRHALQNLGELRPEWIQP